LENPDEAKNALEIIMNYVEPKTYTKVFAHDYFNAIPNNKSRKLNIYGLQ